MREEKRSHQQTHSELVSFSRVGGKKKKEKKIQSCQQLTQRTVIPQVSIIFFLLPFFFFIKPFSKTKLSSEFCYYYSSKMIQLIQRVMGNQLMEFVLLAGIELTAGFFFFFF